MLSKSIWSSIKLNCIVQKVESEEEGAVDSDDDQDTKTQIKITRQIGQEVQDVSIKVLCFIYFKNNKKNSWELSFYFEKSSP